MLPRISRLGARLLRESRAETRAGWYLHFPLSSFPSVIGGILVIGLLLISCGEVLLTSTSPMILRNVNLAVDTNVSCIFGFGILLSLCIANVVTLQALCLLIYC
jgi:hypothetical protein